MIWSVVTGVPLPRCCRVTVNSSSVPSCVVTFSGNGPVSPLFFASLISAKALGSTVRRVDGILFPSLSTASTLPKISALSGVRSGSSIP